MLCLSWRDMHAINTSQTNTQTPQNTHTAKECARSLHTIAIEKRQIIQHTPIQTSAIHADCLNWRLSWLRVSVCTDTTRHDTKYVGKQQMIASLVGNAVVFVGWIWHRKKGIRRQTPVVKFRRTFFLFFLFWPIQEEYGVNGRQWFILHSFYFREISFWTVPGRSHSDCLEFCSSETDDSIIHFVKWSRCSHRHLEISKYFTNGIIQCDCVLDRTCYESMITDSFLRCKCNA